MVESISMGVAMNWLKRRYPDEIIVAMPPNNPGYDIRVGENSNPKFFVEVEGTQASVPVFWLSEGERKFSVANADSCIFLVVSGINLTGDSPPLISVRTGALEGSDVLLEPFQWRGQLSGITTQAS